MQEQHFPFLDKEREWLSLEIPDIAFSILFGILVGFAIFILTNPVFALVGAIFTTIAFAVFLIKKKRGKARGWFVRQLYFIFRLWNIIY